MAETKITPAELISGLVLRRQGGNASNWSTPGTNNYDVDSENVKIQCGVIAVAVDPTIVTFPVAFSNPPVVVATQLSVNSSSSFVRINSSSASQVSITQIDPNGAVDTSEFVAWVAIGI